MKIKRLHTWKLSIKKAKELQIALAPKVIRQAAFKSIKEIGTVAGCDVSFSGRKVRAAVVVLKLPGLEPVAKIVLEKPVKGLFPYVPGYLSFREAPVILEAVKKLKEAPDAFLIDGQGLAHPRQIGIASHIGLFMDKPTVGCAKSWLYGVYEEPPPGVSGAYTFLKAPENEPCGFGGEFIGIVLRTRAYVKPVFVSIGHKIDLELAGDLVMACIRKYRIPEPLRVAHSLAKTYYPG